MNMTAIKVKALKKYDKLVALNLTEDSIEDIADVVAIQEVVNYSNSKGSVTFDVNDFVY